MKKRLLFISLLAVAIAGISASSVSVQMLKEEKSTP